MHRLLGVLFLAALARGSNFNQQVRLQNHIKNNLVIYHGFSHIGTNTAIF